MNARKFAVVLWLLLELAKQDAYAQQAPPVTLSQPPSEPNAIPLYGSASPGDTTTENWSIYNERDYVVRNVTRPTLTPVLPEKNRATGTAIVVAPGGAFMLLAIGPEGWTVAQALADRGIAAFVLKYRVMSTPPDSAAAATFMDRAVKRGVRNPKKMPTLQYPPSTDDALAALAHVREHADQWGIDPKRVGMIGFSAGAMTALNATLRAQPGKGPDFIAYIYGPQAKVAVPAHAPPMFVTIAFDDPLFPTMGFPIVEAWRQAKRPVELHAYGRGGHGYGLGIPGTTTPMMLDQFIAWLNMQGFLNARPVN
jgi:acetyl esterase/lipase